MTGILAPSIVFQGLGFGGLPLPGGKLFSYVAGTSTPQPTWTDSTQLEQNLNPVILNANGQAAVWLDPTLTYKFILQDQFGNQVGVAADQVQGSLTAAALSALLPALLAAIITQSYIGALLYPQTAAEIAAGVTPANSVYPEGYFLRYIASWVSGQADTSLANTNALNTATAVCAQGKAVLMLPAGLILITATWNCTASSAASNTTNLGLTVQGTGMESSIIQYISGANNIGNAWDMVGLAYGSFKNFRFIGGSGTSNCPLVTLLQGSGKVGGGRLFSGIMLFQEVDIEGYGDYIVWNSGAENIDYIDCTSIAFRDSTFPNARPWVFVASGSDAGQSSAFVLMDTPCPSMTVIHWYGSKAAMIFHGLFGIVFHFTAANCAVADIRFDDWFQTAAASGTFTYMSDDSAGSFANTQVNNCGGERLTMECNTVNTAMEVCNFGVSLPKGIKFEGHAASSVSLSTPPFVFIASAIPTDCWFDWDPNESAGFAGGSIVAVQGFENGIYVRAPVATALLVSAPNSRTIDGFPGFGFAGNGSDYAQLLGTHFVNGANGNGVFNRTRKISAGAIVSANSQGNEGVQTTQAVTGASAITILNIPNFANLVAVTGADAGGDKFCDLLWVTFTTFNVIQSATESGSPSARTYSVATNLLKVVMTTGTYNIQCSCQGFGMQA